MHPTATVFFDVCVQRDFWPGGAWPLLEPEHAENVARLFAIAAASSVRQGGVVCRHRGEAMDVPPDRPVHCRDGDGIWDRPAGCVPKRPIEIAGDGEAAALAPDHGRATYLDSGCRLAPDDGPERARAFRHLTAGVRDAVVFGAGVEYGIDHAIDALLRRRIRTHVVLDAVGAADEIAAQTIVAGWKRRGVDGLTVDVVARFFEIG